MNKATLALALIFILCLAADPGPPSPGCAGAKVAWLTYDQALVAGRQKNLPIILYFRRNGCRYCELLTKNGFGREDIACYLNRKFTAAFIDTARQPDLSRKFRVAGEPTVWFLEPDGKEIDYFVGYVPPEHLSLVLRFIGDGDYKKMSFDDFKRREERNPGGVK